MTNSYFDTPNWSRLARATLARAEAVNAIVDAVVTGFSLLPTPTDIKKGLITFVAADTGAVNAYAIAQTYVPASYSDGMEIIFRAASSNTGAATVNVNALGAVALRDYTGTALAAAMVLANTIVIARYDAANNYFRIVAPNVTNTGTVNVANGIAVGTASQITVTQVGVTGTISLPAAVTMPGSLVVTTTLNVTGLSTLTGGVTVPVGTGSTLNTASIAGLTATLLGQLTGGTQVISGGSFQGSLGKINALGSISGSNGINYNLGNVVTATQNANTLTFTYSNWPASGTYGAIEHIVALDSTPHSVTFTGGGWDTNLGAPTLVASKTLHVLAETIDGGSTIRLSLIGQF